MSESFSGKRFLSAHRLFLAGCGVVVLLKLLLLALDPRPGFFLGDSLAFLGTAMTGWFPPQRSWAYGYVVGLLAYPGKGFFTLVVVQTLGGILTACIAGWCLIRYFDVKGFLAFVVMVILALDPLHLLYERMVMSETLALTGVACFLFFALAYLERPDWRLLVLAELAFFGAVLMRLQMLYPLMPVAVCLPLLARWRHAEDFPWRNTALHLVAALALIVFTHGAYRQAMAVKNEQPPAYSYGNHLILIGSFAPVLELADAGDAGVQKALETGLAKPLDDRNLRNDHAWAEGGLARALIDHTGDFYKADQVAGDMLRSALLRDPMGMAIAGWRNYADHLDVTRMSHWLAVDRGSLEYPPEVQEILEKEFGYVAQQQRQTGLVRALHAAGHPYYFLLALSPLVFLAGWFTARAEHRIPLGIVCLTGVLFILQNLGLSCLPSMRLLHPVSLPLWIVLGIMVDRLLKQRSHS